MHTNFRKLALISSVMLASFTSFAAHVPSLSIHAEDPSFYKLINEQAQPELITDSAVWAEGPVCKPDGEFIFSDARQNRVLSWTKSQGAKIWLSPSDYQNGHAVDAKGRIIAASQGKRALLRQESNGQWTVLADSYQGKRLNSPNDVTVAPDGSIWFTDPTFGILNPQESYGGTPEQEGEFVYRYDTGTHTLTRADTVGMHTPNGLAFSPDGKIFYVSDSQSAHDPKNKSLAHRIMAYRVHGATLSDGHQFAEVSPGVPDGIRTDEKGNLWSSSQTGVQVFSPQGKLLGKIGVPAKDTGNLALCTDESDNKWLYVTASNLALRVPVLVNGSTGILLHKQ